jgi:L-threonylcarbamoyladenylate synthase
MPTVPADVQRAAQLLEEGGVVAFPTETVYGLGALASDGDAVARVFEMKGRPPAQPLIVHLASANAIDRWALRVPEYAQRLADSLWPGPLTLVLPAREDVLEVVRGGGATVGLRVPDHPLALALIDELVTRRGLGVGIAAPSANRYGEPPPTSAQAVVAGLGAPAVDDPSAPDMILDGGTCPGGVPSTVLSCDGPWPRILRYGATSREQIEEVIGRFVDQ